MRGIAGLTLPVLALRILRAYGRPAAAPPNETLHTDAVLEFDGIAADARRCGC
jgi:hypothetical protein